MKRKIFVALLLVFALTCSLFAFTSCKDKDDGGNNTTTVEKQIPVYQGMTITNSNTSALLTNESYNLRKPMLANSNNGNNGNHYGHYKGDCTDNEGELDNNNPYPDNRDNIDVYLKLLPFKWSYTISKAVNCESGTNGNILDASEPTSVRIPAT